MTSAEQYQMLTDIWPRWRTVATSLRPDTNSTALAAAKRKAVLATKALYEFYGFTEPDVVWIDDTKSLPAPEHPPLVCHFRESLIFSAWHKLADPTWVCSQVGYDRRQHVFRLPGNMRTVLGRMRITPAPRDRRRPRWLVEPINVVSQFDADALAIHELADKLGRVDPEIKKLAKITERIATSCFAALLFEGSCVLIMKPHQITLSETQLLSAQGGPAIEWSSKTGRSHAIFAINGDVLSLNEPPIIDINRVTHMPARERALLIEYIGWEEFFKLLERCRYQQMTRLSRDDYGSLYRIWFFNQEIMVVRVKNRTKEPDGTYRRYVIPVDTLCRPLPDPNRPHERLGDPQPLTALNAVASTFGMTGRQYAEEVGSES